MADSNSNRSFSRILARLAVRQPKRLPVSRCEPLSSSTPHHGIPRNSVRLSRVLCGHPAWGFIQVTAAGYLQRSYRQLSRPPAAMLEDGHGRLSSTLDGRDYGIRAVPDSQTRLSAPADRVGDRSSSDSTFRTAQPDSADTVVLELASSNNVDGELVQSDPTMSPDTQSSPSSGDQTCT